MQGLYQRGETIGRARRVRNDLITRGQGLVVYPVDDGRQILAGRRRDDHLSGAPPEVGAGFVFAGKKTGTFDHYINLQVSPRKVGRVALGQTFDLVAVHDHVVTFYGYGAGESTMRGVVLCQVCVCARVAQIVDSHDFDFVGATAFVQCTQYVSSDSTVTVNPYSNGH